MDCLALSLAIFFPLCFGLIKQLDLVPILANERWCAETVYVQKIICIMRKDNTILLRSQNNAVVPKEKFSCFYLTTSTVRSEVGPSCMKKHDGAPRALQRRGWADERVKLIPNHLGEGRCSFLLTGAAFCPPIVQLVGVGLHWIHLHSLALTFAVVVHWRGVWLAPGVWLVYWCLGLFSP